MEKMLIIGIAGGSGSGKSTITELIAAEFGQDCVTVMRHDDYYKAQHELTYEERAKQNYDAPQAFETSLMVKQLNELRAGKSIECPIYDYTIHDRSAETRTIVPTRVLVIDGILVLAEKELRDCMDIKIYVDTDADVRVLRRIRRDMMSRGRSFESVMDQYLSTVKPMHEMYVEPSKKYADIIVPEGGRNMVAMEIIMNRIAAHLNKKEN